MKKTNYLISALKYIFLAVFLCLFAKSASSQIYTPELDSAYHLLHDQKVDEAIPLFEDHIRQYPEDTKVYMQLAYIYDAKGNYTKALQYFQYVAKNSTDPVEKDQAEASVAVMKDKANANAKRTIELGFTSYYDTYQKNYITALTAYYKFRLSPEFYVGPYLDLYTDSRSMPGLIYNDRYLELGLFARFYMLPNFYFENRIGIVREFDLDTTRINISPRLVYGLSFGDRQTFISDHPKQRSSFFVDLYAALSYDYKFRNAFFQTGFQEVFRNNLKGYSYLDFFLVQYLTVDSRRLDYNNLVEFGAGVRYKPNLQYFPDIFLMPTYKFYFYGTPTNSFQLKAGFSFNLNIKG